MAAETIGHGSMNPHRFESHHKDALINDERASEQPAEDIISRANIHPGDVVADLGCGNGYFAIPLTEMAHRVLALDLSHEMLDDLLDRANDAQREKLRPIRCELPELPLRASGIDHVLMVNVLHEIGDKEVIVKEIMRVLKEGGTVSIVDFQKRPTKRGPPMEERIDESDIPKLFPDLILRERHSFASYYQFEFVKSP
jgi:ubiquinone/menaquinone biosynthesis C-methylase UbiE